MPLSLIDKKDNWELIRDEIASILAVETANQQQLASDAGKDPALWKFDVYVERTRPWEMLDAAEDALSPFVNVWFDALNFNSQSSTIASPQTAEDSVYNLDVVAAAKNEKLTGEGYLSGDKQAVLDCHRVVRLVRNILFSVPPDSTQPGDNYLFLNLPGVVGRRRIQAINTFQPDDKKQGLSVYAARVVFAVKHIETSLEGPYKDFDLLQAQTVFNEDGSVNYTFDFTV